MLPDKLPSISVIIPCFNQAQFLPEALESVLDQSYSNWECIIVNDGSPDDTENVAFEWCKSDVRFKYLRKENGGLSSARNAGLNIAKGRYIQFLDSDDIIDKDKFSVSMQVFEERPAVGVVVSDFKLISKDLLSEPFCKLEQNQLNFNSLLYKWDIEFTIPIHCAVFDLNIVHELKFNEDLQAKEDWLMWLEVFRSNPRAVFIEKSLAFYRQHSNTMTSNPELMNLNHIKVYDYIFEFLDSDEIPKFSKHTINQLLQRNIKLNHQIQILSNSKKSPLRRKITKIVNLFRTKH